MNNTEIIYNTAIAKGIVDEDKLNELIDEIGDVPYHTFQAWKQAGYMVKKGQKALFDARLWKHVNRKLTEAEQAEKDSDPEADEQQKKGKWIKVKSYLFSWKQVEKIKPRRS